MCYPWTQARANPKDLRVKVLIYQEFEFLINYGWNRSIWLRFLFGLGLKIFHHVMTYKKLKWQIVPLFWVILIVPYCFHIVPCCVHIVPYCFQYPVPLFWVILIVPLGFVILGLTQLTSSHLLAFDWNGFNYISLEIILFVSLQLPLSAPFRFSIIIWVNSMYFAHFHEIVLRLVHKVLRLVYKLYYHDRTATSGHLA